MGGGADSISETMIEFLRLGNSDRMLKKCRRNFLLVNETKETVDLGAGLLCGPVVGWISRQGNITNSTSRQSNVTNSSVWVGATTDGE